MAIVIHCRPVLNIILIKHHHRVDFTSYYRTISGPPIMGSARLEIFIKAIKR